MDMKDFDGIHFLPGDEDDEMQFTYFKMGGDIAPGKKVNSTDIGDMFHIAFFKEDEDGHPEFDEEFEAIFADPVTYISNLIGYNLYGCVLRKTENSTEWWNEYLARAKENCNVMRSNTQIQAST